MEYLKGAFFREDYAHAAAAHRKKTWGGGPEDPPADLRQVPYRDPSRPELGVFSDEELEEFERRKR